GASELHSTASTGLKIGLGAVATIVALAGIAGAVVVYLKGRRDLAQRIEAPILARGWGYDDAITAFTGGPGRRIFEAITTFDRTVIDGAVNGIATLVRQGSTQGRRTQSGLVRNYALGVAFGAIVLT